MNSDRRNLLKLAIILHETLQKEVPKGRPYFLPQTTWEECVALDRQIRRADSRGLHLAAKRRRREMLSGIRQLTNDLRAVEQAIALSTGIQHISSIRGIFADLSALQAEFEDVVIDWKQKTLSVTTEPITLRDIELGPFEIRLAWDDSTADHPFDYSVVALEPNLPISSDTTTHPHVQDDSVCEGDACVLIRRALEEGRLLDFFLVLRSLLRTYNDAGPYVRLEDWHGVECPDCGQCVQEDERWTCEQCETAVCGECYFTCPGCQDLFCGECVTQCKECGDSYCNNCINNNERCEECNDQETENETDKKSEAPVQSDRVGETAVPA